jgi:hypothetical protein
VYHSTGFDREEIIDLCIRVNSVERETGTPGWPPCLGLFKSVVAAQVACTIHGKLAWISDPVNGSRHDSYCQEESGVLLTMNSMNWIGARSRHLRRLSQR